MRRGEPLVSEDPTVNDDDLVFEEPGVGGLEVGADPADLLQVAQALDHVAEDECVLERFEFDVADPDL